VTERSFRLHTYLRGGREIGCPDYNEEWHRSVAVVTTGPKPSAVSCRCHFGIRASPGSSTRDGLTIKRTDVVAGEVLRRLVQEIDAGTVTSLGAGIGVGIDAGVRRDRVIYQRPPAATYLRTAAQVAGELKGAVFPAPPRPGRRPLIGPDRSRRASSSGIELCMHSP
jgi:hypothetical protein